MKVLIGTPAYGGQLAVAYFNSILELLSQANGRGVQIDIMTITNESLITRARNDVLHEFMAGDYTDLLFIDSDIRFTPEHVWRLLEAPYDFVATPYPMKGLNWENAQAVGAAGGTPEQVKESTRITVVNPHPEAIEDGNGFSTVLDAGTGFMRVRRCVAEQLIAAHPEAAYVQDGKPGTRYAIFDTIIHDGRFLSEDYTFCRRWQLIGGNVWCDVASPSLGHQGAYTFGE